MLINLTHHPNSGWAATQKKAAERYGKVVDMPFPKVDPMATTLEIHGLARELLFKILEFQAIAEGEITVLLMGEMTLTFALTRLLKEEGIPAMASTSERKVTMNNDGTRLVEFQFLQFRHYY